MRVKFWVLLEPQLSGEHLVGVTLVQTLRKTRPSSGVAIPIELEVDASLFTHPTLQARVGMVEGSIQLMPGLFEPEGEDHQGHLSDD